MSTGKGYKASPVFRATARTESYLQSLVPFPISPLGPQDPVDVRFAPRESKDIVLNLDPMAMFMQVYFRFQVKNEYAGTTETGTISRSAGSTRFTGAGTSFISRLVVGDVLWYVNAAHTVVYNTVTKILTATTLTVSGPNTTAATASAFGVMRGRNIPTDAGVSQRDDWTAGTIFNTGTLSIGTASSAVVGVGTLFTSQLVAGDKIQVFGNAGREQYFIIDTITDDTHATIRGYAAETVTAKPYTRFYTRYSDFVFNIYTAAGVWLGETNVAANQGAFGSVNLATGQDGIIHRNYLYGRSDAIILTIRNTQNDARRLHGHVGGVRVLT